MATTLESLYNDALANLGVSAFVEDASEDDSQEAQLCNRFWERARAAVFAAWRWPFATKQVALEAAEGSDHTPVQGSAGDAPATKAWAYLYAIPEETGGLTTPHRIWPGQRQVEAEAKVPFDVVTVTDPDDSGVSLTVIGCDLEDAWLEYGVVVEDVAAYPPAFADAVAWELSARIAMPLTAKPELANWARQNAQLALERAAAAALRQGQGDVAPECEFIRVRR